MKKESAQKIHLSKSPWIYNSVVIFNQGKFLD
jgi:hypothetical protein